MSWRCILRLGHMGELHFEVITGELTSRETIWGVVNTVGQDPVGRGSVKSVGGGRQGLGRC